MAGVLRAVGARSREGESFGMATLSWGVAGVGSACIVPVKDQNSRA